MTVGHLPIPYIGHLVPADITRPGRSCTEEATRLCRHIFHMPAKYVGLSGQPYAGRSYAGRPYSGQPNVGQPYAGQPLDNTLCHALTLPGGHPPDISPRSCRGPAVPGEGPRQVPRTKKQQKEFHLIN